MEGKIARRRLLGARFGGGKASIWGGLEKEAQGYGARFLGAREKGSCGAEGGGSAALRKKMQGIQP